MKPITSLFLFLLASCVTEEKNTSDSGIVSTETFVPKTTQAKKVAVPPMLEVSGSLEPIASVQLGFDVPGRLSRLRVSRGQTVTVGTVIAELDTRLADAQLAQAEAGLQAAESQYNIAKSTFERLEKLQDGISPQQLSEARAGFGSATAIVDQAKAAVQLAKTNLSFHTLRAPIRGIVTNAPDNVGLLVGAGTPLFVIEDLSSLQLKVSVPASESWITPGLSVALDNRQEVVGEVVRVLPSLDPSTRRLPVEISLKNTETEKAHSFTRAKIQGPPMTAFEIPKGALVAKPEFSVISLGSDGTPKIIPVVVVGDQEGTVLVRGPLEDGQTLVIDPPYGYGE